MSTKLHVYDCACDTCLEMIEPYIICIKNQCTMPFNTTYLPMKMYHTFEFCRGVWCTRLKCYVLLLYMSICMHSNLFSTSHACTLHQLKMKPKLKFCDYKKTSKLIKYPINTEHISSRASILSCVVL